MGDGRAAEPVPGALVTVIKLHPDGQEVTRYDAIVADEVCPDRWFAVNATWVNRTVSPHGLVFESGDTLVEYFSPDEWFNVFRVQSPRGETRGWYANVTYPTRVGRERDEITVTWHDLYLDVVKLAAGTVIICDEDELAESDLATSDPELHARIIDTAHEMHARAGASNFPFHRRN